MKSALNFMFKRGRYFTGIAMERIKCKFSELQLRLHREQDFPFVCFCLPHYFGNGFLISLKKYFFTSCFGKICSIAKLRGLHLPLKHAICKFNFL